MILFGAASINAQESTASKQTTALSLGLLPHLSPNLLLKKYEKLVQYLEHQLQRKIVVHTAPNFKTYIQRATEGRYDLYLTAPHMAAYHEAENAHRRVAVFNKNLFGFIAVLKDSSFENLSDLQGKTVSMADPMAVITLLGEAVLLKNNVETTVHYAPTHNSALHSVAFDQAEAAIVGGHAYQITTESGNLRKPLRLLGKTDPIPHMMFMASNQVAGDEYEALKSALLDIENEATGRAFIHDVPFGTLIPITDQHMQSLSGMVMLLKQRLHQ